MSGEYVIRKGKSLFKFPSSGIGVEIFPVSVFIQTDIQLEFEESKPQPPVERVEVGDGNFIEEKNWKNEEYLAKLQEWFTNREVAVMDEMIRMGAVANLDKTALAEVETLRRYYRERRNKELDVDNNFVYIKYLLCKTAEDYQRFTAALQGRSNPTEGAVAAAIENTFPGNS